MQTNEISEALNGEKPDFVVVASRRYNLKSALAYLGLSLFWIFISGLAFSVFVVPLLAGKTIDFKSGGQDVSANAENLGPAIAPALVISVFLLIGLIFFAISIYLIFAKGLTYAGTSDKLIIYGKNKTRFIDWKDFSTDIEVNGDNRKGDLILKMKTGQMIRGEDGMERYVTNALYISGIQGALEIEPIIRKRIEENDGRTQLIR